MCERRIPPKDVVQTLAVAYWVFHYAKRIFETFFVHRRAMLRISTIALLCL